MAGYYYHYTTGQAFTDIAKSKSFWLTNGRYLNDPMDCDDRGDELKNLADVHLTGELKTAFMKARKNLVEAYVTSFAKSSDSLLHWRAYGDDGAGIALGFDPAVLVPSDRAPGGYRLDPKVMLSAQPVIYKQSKLDEYLRLIFESSVKRVEAGENVKSVAVNMLLTSKTILCGYKHESWAGEDETRLIHLAITSATEVLTRGFRVNRGNLYDYVVSPFQAEALKTVTIGPKCSFDKGMVERFLSKLGYSNFTIERSKLLYR